MDASQILQRDEIKKIVTTLRQRAKWYGGKQSPKLSLAIFRLSCCCGLRRCEIRGLNMGDFILTGTRPVIRIRKDATKGRIDPLWWDKGTLADFLVWWEIRKKQGAGKDDPFIVALFTGGVGMARKPAKVLRRMTLDGIACRWKSIMRILGKERAKQVSIHKGRHSFCSHSALMGRSIIEIQKAAGHASVDTTSIYLHLLERDNVPDVFGV
jgi:integrase